MMIKIIEARYQGNFQIALSFSTGQEGVFDGNLLLQRSGPLLAPLRAEPYFRRAFIDAGTLCWPNGLELSPSKIYESCQMLEEASMT